MADKKITALTENTALVSTDLFHIVDDPSSSPSNQKITVANIFNKIPTTIGYGTDAVSSVTVSDSTQALDGKALFLCTGTGSTVCVATMSDGDHVGQTITVSLVATAPTSFTVTPSTLLGGTSVSIDAVGDSATLVWTGSAWFVQSLGGAASVNA